MVAVPEASTAVPKASVAVPVTSAWRDWTLLPRGSQAPEAGAGWPVKGGGRGATVGQ